MGERSNTEWVADLASTGAAQEDALADLHAALIRAARFYAQRRLAGSDAVSSEEVGALAEDIAQDAAMLVLQKLETFRGEAKFLTWASSFAILRARATLRRRVWQDLSLDSITDSWQEPTDSSVFASGWTNPQLAAQRRAMWDVVNDVIKHDLTDRQRQVLNLLVLHCVPTEDVEDYLGVTPSALYKMTHDARRKLKAGLEKRGFTTAEILSAFAAQG